MYNGALALNQNSLVPAAELVGPMNETSRRDPETESLEEPGAAAGRADALAGLPCGPLIQRAADGAVVVRTCATRLAATRELERGSEERCSASECGRRGIGGAARLDPGGALRGTECRRWRP
ncbi:hypothetical protein NDU88_008571 [Pleurodeles waltl]|uniref:Uncharacterized protein n=1 Tax=Pleurodeles waltl TaxID=8319 RepID=A0AAV7PQ64_PLEWA|nr:hypothetical protein NDU88_008571 [Pleurodeles waltl]